jgi:cytochrome c biogenesis protein
MTMSAGTSPGSGSGSGPRLGPVGWLRFGWRQLTSMRTALFLLLLLAVAAVPGSVLPQRGVNPGKVTEYLQQHPGSGRWLDRLGGFDVYASVWFSAIYLLLFVSLIGCVLPRTRQHAAAIRSAPPRVPARLDRLPAHRQVVLPLDADLVLARAEQALRRRRFRVEVRDVEGGPGGGAGDTRAISAERGRLRESGNLLFHLSLIVVLLGVAFGYLLGWRGDVVVPVGQTFSNAVVNYDTLRPGPWVDTERLPPFSVSIDRLKVSFETSANQRGAPREFRADITSQAGPAAPPVTGRIEVNHPLAVDGAKVYLLGNGYAPVITVRDSKGDPVYSDATVFPPQDASYVSAGVVRAVGARPQQLGVQGVLLPTAALGAARPTSLFPDALDPVLLIGVYEGDLGLGSGNPPGSVYQLDTSRMTQLRTSTGAVFSAALRPGQTVRLPGGKGSVTFERLERFAGLTVRHDPGRRWVLGGGVAAMLGLATSLFVPRRRVFVRVLPAGPEGSGPAGSGGAGPPVSGAGAPPRTLVEVGALARGEDTGLDDEITRLLAAVRVPLGKETR